MKVYKSLTNEYDLYKNFWNSILQTPNYLIISFKIYIEYLLNEFGTKLPCNRFNIGNCIEYIISDHLKKMGFIITDLSNAKRIDIMINNKLLISIKYSSVGNITLHNSNSMINIDTKMHNLLLLTNDFIYLILPDILYKYKININDYLINTGDSLKLKRSILTKLKNNNYPHILCFKLNINKDNCKNRECSKLFYKMVKYEIKKKFLNK
jgi:hypothetical protein